MEEDGRGTICIAFQAKIGHCGFHTRDFIPGYSRFALWRLPDALSHDGGWQTDVAAGDVIGPSRRQPVETLRATSLRKLPQKHTKKGANLVEIDS